MKVEEKYKMVAELVYLSGFGWIMLTAQVSRV